MTAGLEEVPERWSVPAETLVVGQDGAVVLVIAGALVLPLGSRIRLAAEGPDATVVGIRLVVAAPGPPQLILEIDTGAASLDVAALEEADAEAQVVEAAELITSLPLDGPPADPAAPDPAR